MLFVEPALSDRIRPIAGRPLLPDSRCCPTPTIARSRAAIWASRYGDWLDEVAEESGPLEGPDNELDPIAINYTSGTTGRPKGAVYTHRGAYLNALGVALELGLSPSSNYLWTLPMFHCNGWCFTWAVTAVGGSHVSLADFDPGVVLDLIDRHRVSHLCGAPVVLNEIASRVAHLAGSSIIRFASQRAAPRRLRPPSQRCATLGIGVTHLYGLTETYGPSIICEVQPQWADLDHRLLRRPSPVRA